MPRRQDAQKAGGHKTTRAISGREERGAAEPIEAQARSKPLPGKAKPFAPGLYLVATPIGNLRDITLRALDLLGAADLVACEDTRVSGKLMAHYGLAAPLTPYHEHNAERARPQLIERLKSGGIVALVSDAGIPLVSDPGYKLVRAALADGISVTALPGASAVLTGLVLSGLPPDRFLFAGFLPPKSAARKTALGELATLRATLIFFETAPRLAASLADMAESLGARQAAVARELTKLYEEVRRGSLAELAEHYRAAGPPKGELVIVIEPAPQIARIAAADDALDAELSAALVTMSIKDASAVVAAATGQPRRVVYQRALVLAGRSE
jgi:16S rRNA (cytidine1402-2'-O)-methyltransferase